MRLSEFSYHLPKELIAQQPITPRDHSRLLVIDRAAKRLQHQHFYDLPSFLKPGDVLVFNNTKVFPARLLVKKVKTGGQLEIFLLKELKAGTWECLIGGASRREGQAFTLGPMKGVIIKRTDDTWTVRFSKTGPAFWQVVEKYGHTPTPPYVKTPDTQLQKARYQTVYARERGSVAAPTAGFHFTKPLLAKLKRSGIQEEFVTLHVGLGTFQPVKVERIENHQLHSEWAQVDAATLKRLVAAKKAGRRIIAVGTTSVRVLETVFKSTQPKAFKGWINTFIYPGKKFKAVDAMITNFHLPESSLLMLVAAFMDQKNARQGIRFTNKVYQTAVRQRYRFYSFGDAMLIL